MSRSERLLAVLAALVLCWTSACSKSPTSDPAGTPGGVPELPARYVLATAPADAIGVRALRDAMPREGEVKVLGRVKDFVDGRAMFTIVDASVPSCADRPGDNCTTPWDYCCEEPKSLARNTATVEFHGDDDAIVRARVKGVSGIDHLTRVVVVGKAVQDSAGNLTIRASGLGVQR